MNIKKYIIGGVLAAAFAVYVFFTNSNSSALIVPEPSTTTGSTTLPTTATANATLAGSAPTPTPTPVPTATPTTATDTGQYKNGTYTGSVADAFYGNLQAVAVIQGGKLVNITFAQQPTNGHSGQISTQALPILKQEAIATQSANVNAVSGATQLSQAFDQSLASALALAKN